MPPRPDLDFLAWLSERPLVRDALLSKLPDELFSREGQQVVALLREGHQWEHNGVTPSDEEARAFLRTQLLAYLGREAGRAQRTGHLGRVEAGMQLLRECTETTDPLPIELFAEIRPRIREFVPTGVGPLDEQIQGIARGELGIVACPSGRGKTCLLINFAVAALRQGQSVLYISVADQGRDELLPRMDACILGKPPDLHANESDLAAVHTRATQAVPGSLWIADFTDRVCTLADIERAVQECASDLVIVDHADDVASPWNDPAVTRHSLRAIYLSLKQMAVKWEIPLWTASQTHEASWRFSSAGINELAEAKTGKASGSSIVLVFTGGRSEVPGVICCNIAKARRTFTERTVMLRIDYACTRVW